MVVNPKEIRKKIMNIDEKRVSVSLLENSIQEDDISEPVNCEGFGRIRRFKMNAYEDWNSNPLPNEPAAHKLHLDDFEILRTQLFQVSGCNWNCWYCFVDDELRKGDPSSSTFFSSDELLSKYIIENNRPEVIVLSGGQPDLVPEWIIWMMEALIKKGLEKETFLWSDDNLSTNFYFKYLSMDEREKIAAYTNYAKVGCFKGFDEKSFVFNTNAPAKKFGEQFQIFDQLRREELDLYGYVTFTSPPNDKLQQTMESFVTKLHNIHDKLPLRIVPLKIFDYSPSSIRMSEDHYLSLQFQLTVLASWTYILNELYSKKERSKKIYEIKIN